MAFQPPVRPRGMFVGTAHARWPLLATCLGLVVTVAALGGGAGVVPALLMSVVFVLGLTRVEVRVDHQGVEALLGPWNWPRKRIPIDEIQRATAVELRPMLWGGWGYRGSLRLFRRAAIVVRKGEALRLDLTRGRTFAVTVDDAAAAAAVVNDLMT